MTNIATKLIYRTVKFTATLGLAIVIVSFAFGLVIAAIDWFNPPIVTVRNESGIDVHDVVVSGRGFSKPLQSIAAGETKQVEVYPAGESGLTLEFVGPNGRAMKIPFDIYFEMGWGYMVDVTILSGLEAKAKTRHRNE